MENTAYGFKQSPPPSYDQSDAGRNKVNPYPGAADASYNNPQGYPAGYTAYPGPSYPTPYQPDAVDSAKGYRYPGPAGDVPRHDSALMADTSVTVMPADHSGALSDESDWTGASFSQKSIRQAFIRKVFLILLCQLLVTVGCICLFLFCEPVRNWVTTPSNWWFYMIAYGVFFVTYFVLICVPRVRRAWPGNIICLSIFTLALSYMTATISSYHDTEIVLIAIAITTAVCLSLALFAIQTKIDFTLCSGLLFALCMVVFFFGLACIIGGAFTGYRTAYILHCVYAGLAALLFSLFLVYDIQVVVGGRKYELSPEEYIFGALQIYLDVVYLFIIILSLFGGGGRK